MWSAPRSNRAASKASRVGRCISAGVRWGTRRSKWRLVIPDGKKKGGGNRKRPPGIDLAEVEADPGYDRTGVAGKELATNPAGIVPDTIGSFLRDGRPDTATGILGKALRDMDPLGNALKREARLGSVLAEGELRRALAGQNRVIDEDVMGASLTKLGDRSVASMLTNSIRDDLTGRGSLAERTVREIEDTQRRMADLVLGRTPRDDRLATAVEAAQSDLGRLATTYASGGAAMKEIDRVYGSLGAGPDRNRLLSQLAGLGSLARIAAGLADPSTDMRNRAGSLFTDARRWQGPDTAAGAIEAHLRADYSDIFPTMRRPRRSEIEEVIALSRSMADHGSQAEALGEMRDRLVRADVPWVHDDLPDASITAMGRLGGLDGLVRAAPPAEAEVVEALRTHLGDYREGDMPDPATLDDPIARTGYQLERGFDPTLTVLPTAMVAVMFSPFAPADPAVDVDPDHVENAVRMLVKRLERALRRFIAQKLREMHGDEWFEALPSDIRRSWTAGRQRDIDGGREPDEIIAYADIDHYRKIIEHPERWERLFEPVFRDQAAIRETLRRIAVIRNPSAHFRAVTLEDLIILRAEGVHLARWLGMRLGDN